MDGPVMNIIRYFKWHPYRQQSTFEKYLHSKISNFLHCKKISYRKFLTNFKQLVYSIKKCIIYLLYILWTVPFQSVIFWNPRFSLTTRNFNRTKRQNVAGKFSDERNNWIIFPHSLSVSIIFRSAASIHGKYWYQNHL